MESPTHDNETRQLTGIHHLTAVTAHAAQNRAFYTETLGLRLVKKTVNQDDTTAYHLFYADGLASPGSDITFFDFRTKPERRGTNSIVRTAFRIHPNAFDYWRDRFDRLKVKHGGIIDRDGRLTIDFEDFEGQRLSLIEDGASSSAHAWERSPVPAAQQIKGLGPITISVPELQPTDAVLTGLMGMRPVRRYETPGHAGSTTHVYEMGAGGPSAELHVAVEADLARHGPGSGGAHHVAFRIPDADLKHWAGKLDAARLPKNGPIDRFYFKSLYFREPNGILFEIATDGPGFTADEPLESLGQGLALPPFLEPRRAEIEAGLKPL